MPFNTTKCKVMHLGRNNSQFQYFMNNHALEAVAEEKDLGLYITNNLKPSRQCQQAYAKVSRALGLIARTISYKSSDLLLQLYKSLVRPHLEYRVSAWSPYYDKDKHLLERIQHRFTRMIPGMRHLPYEERLGKLGIWSLEERRNRADLLQVFKMFKGVSSIPFNQPSATVGLPVLEVIRQRSVNHEVPWISEDFSFPKELSIDGISYNRTISNLRPWIPLRTGYNNDEKLRWASSRTRWSPWLFGLVCTGDLHRSRCRHTW